MRNYRELEVWQKSHELTLAIYKKTAKFPQSELYGLNSQIRRAAVSIEANLAEGCGRWGDVEMARFVQIAMGSASELDCHLLIARDLGYLMESDYKALEVECVRVRRMLTGLLQAIWRSDPNGNKQVRQTATSRGTTAQS